MIVSPESTVPCIIINEGDAHNYTLEELFSKFSSISYDLLSGIREINFKDNELNVKVQDMFGYTDLLCIRRLEIESLVPGRTHWDDIIAGDKTITARNDTIIPTYDLREEEIIGFHGEVKRDYQLKYVDNIEETDYVRILPSNGESEYVKPEIKPFSLNVKYGHGYCLVTKSGFCNINGIYIRANYQVATNEAALMMARLLDEYDNQSIHVDIY